MYMGEKKAMDRSEPFNELEKLVIRMNSPRAVIDNVDCATATLVKVDGEMHDLILFKTVQMLSNLSLLIKKAYISTDGQWFMNVFHVTDQNGQKLLDKEKISYIEQFFDVDNETAAVSPNLSCIATFELSGADSPGLLSDIFEVLSNLSFRVIEAKLWTHLGRIAAIISVEGKYGKRIKNPMKISCIQAYLSSIVKGGYVAVFSSSTTSIDHRLHQMMHSTRDYDELADSPSVSIENWTDRGYSTVIVQCQDRPKLLFDVTCTLTEMNYVVFNGYIDTIGDRAYQEFYIRHSEGSPIKSDEERQKVIQCLQAAINRRSSEDLRLELRAPVHRHRFLTEATRMLRENGLSVTMAEVSTRGMATMSVFYVADIAGNQVDKKAIASSIIERFGTDSLKIFHGQSSQSGNMRPNTASDEALVSARLLYLSRLLKWGLFNLGSLLLVAGAASNQADKEAITYIIKRFGADSLKNCHGQPNQSSRKLQISDETSFSARLLSFGSRIKRSLFNHG